MTWKCTYYGKPDVHSTKGYAAPSWHTFDYRTWENGDLMLVLTNLTQESIRKGKGRGRVESRQAVVRGDMAYIRSGTLYKVTLMDSRGEVQAWEGSDWQGLVQQAKEYAKDPDTWLDDKILQALEPFSYYGRDLRDIAVEVFKTHPVNRNHTNPIRARLMWLSKHGFVFARGKPGRGTRWVVENGQERHWGDRG